LALEAVTVERFRCLNRVEFCPDAGLNLIYGANGAGKTSLLEALFYLGRGRSFRSSRNAALIQTDADDFTVFGRIDAGGNPRRVGVRVSRSGSDIHINGEAGGKTAALLEAFPVQVIDPEVHMLVQGGPSGRRQFLDWGVFHVKHDFLSVWRRYRRALQQRNVALRQGADNIALAAWGKELIESGTRIDELRRDYLEGYRSVVDHVSTRLLGAPVHIAYEPGWAQDESLEDALAGSWDKDLKHGSTHVGPHRAELGLEVHGFAARHRLSRGQQKLLGTALVLAQSEFVSGVLGRAVALLVDEPAAELDAEHLERLVDALTKPGLQLFLTTLEPRAIPLKFEPSLFHVKHGNLTTLL
jgi:DNA replication and repair protein RecF